MAFMAPGAGIPPSSNNNESSRRSRSLQSNSSNSSRSDQNNADASGGTKPLDFKGAMRDFKFMFPSLDSETIEMVLRANNGAVDATIDQLLEMCDHMTEGGETAAVRASNAQHRVDNNVLEMASQLSIHPASDNVDSYHLNLSSLTPPPKDTSTVNFYSHSPNNSKTSKKSSINKRSSHRYQTLLYKWDSPLVGPLPDDFLMLKNDAQFDKSELYSRKPRLQVHDIRGNTLDPAFYSRSPADDFGKVSPDVMRYNSNHESAFATQAKSQTNPFANGPPPNTLTNTSTAHSNTGAIPKSSNTAARNWSAKNTISSFGKKIGSLKKSSPAPGILDRSKGTTPSTVNLLNDDEDDDDYDFPALSLDTNFEQDEEDDDELLDPRSGSGSGAGAGAGHRAAVQHASHSTDLFDNIDRYRIN